MKGLCHWCLSIIEKPPEDYNPKKHILFCNIHCYEKEYLFKRWQNDEWLNYKAKKFMEGEDGKDP